MAAAPPSESSTAAFGTEFVLRCLAHEANSPAISTMTSGLPFFVPGLVIPGDGAHEVYSSTPSPGPRQGPPVGYRVANETALAELFTKAASCTIESAGRGEHSEVCWLVAPPPSESAEELTEAQLAQNLNAPSWLPGSVLVPGWVRPTFTVEAIACGNGPVSLTIKRCGVSSTSKPDSPHPVSVKDEAIDEASLSVLQQCGEALWLLTTANAPGVQFMQSTWSFRHIGFPALFSVVGTSYVAAPDLRHETPGELKAQRPGTAPSNARDSAAQGAPTRRPRSAQDLVRLHATYAKELLPSKPSGRAGRLPLARLRAGPQSDVRSKDSFTSEFLERLASTKQGQLLATATSSTGQVHSKGAEGGPILESGSKAWRARLNQPLAFLRADALHSFSLTAHAHPSFKTMFAIMGILLQGRALSWQAAVVALRKGDGFIRQLQRFSAEEVPLARAQAAMDLLPTCTALTPDMAALQHAQAGHLANWTIHAAFWAAAHHGLPPPST